MRVDVLTLFPEMFTPLDHSIVGRARKSGVIDLNVVNIRDFSPDKHKRCDDTPYGGGAGMVMTPDPICRAFNAVYKPGALRVYMSPKGERLTSEIARELSAFPHLIILCGHYEGVDQRAIDLNIDREISAGDYIVTGGELPAMILIDAAARFIPNVLGNPESTAEETFADNFTEYPQYTRPAVYNGLAVPEVLLNGNHKEIEKWRKERQRKIK